jgi:enediyne biosynthesis protein E4
MGVAIGDYLRTGRPSILVTNFENEYDTLYRNNGNWQFDDVSYKSGEALPSSPLVKWGDAFFDVDNDGWLDVIVAAGHVYPQVGSLPSGASYAEPKLLQLNQHDGTFCDASAQAGAAMLEKRVARGLAVGDLFNHRNLDVVIENVDGAPVLLRNRGVPGRHWNSFELAGTKSNRLGIGIGANVKIVSADMTQTGQVLNGGSYLSQNDLRVHFGLGPATRVEEVEVRWPSGSIDVLRNLEVDKFYDVLEGKGLVPAASIRPGAVRGK